MSALAKNRLEKGGLPLWNAVFCLDCEVISSSRGDECPICNDLTATLERLTSVIAPKLARDQAAFHVNVTPSATRLKLQGSFHFAERDAA